jgi:FtsP/CotA-like multicopper oxidase with cupredoxin domain
MLIKRRAPVRLIAAALLACSLVGLPAGAQETPPLSSSDISQPEGWDADLRMPEAQDVNPDPTVLEFSLEAKITEMEILPGTKTPVWAYNGMLPGPLIRAKVGDRLIVHFTNSLPEATTIHWHGVRVPNEMDGTPGLTQDPIPPGGTFEYDFVLEDAGLYWYHPHLNSPAQVAAGLYGAIVVEDPSEPQFADELVLVLSDIALDPDGALRPADRGGAFGNLFGREGDIVLVNGKIHPTVLARAGKPQRWRIVNAAIARYMPVALRGHRWIRVGGDGGLIERAERDIPRSVVAPGERTDLIFTPAAEPGSTQTLSWIGVDRGFGTATARGRTPLLDVAFTSDPPVAPAPIPEALREIPPIDVSGALEQTVELTIDLAKPMSEMMGVNGVAHHQMLMAEIGQTQVWNIVNNTDFDHPFHLHGYFFQVLDDARTPEWKDTVNVPAKSSLRIAIDFDERPGMWMFHCHILDHAEAGMMGHLHVMED